MAQKRTFAGKGRMAKSLFGKDHIHEEVKVMERTWASLSKYAPATFDPSSLKGKTPPPHSESQSEMKWISLKKSTNEQPHHPHHYHLKEGERRFFFYSLKKSYYPPSSFLTRKEEKKNKEDCPSNWREWDFGKTSLSWDIEEDKNFHFGTEPLTPITCHCQLPR